MRLGKYATVYRMQSEVFGYDSVLRRRTLGIYDKLLIRGRKRFSYIRRLHLRGFYSPLGSKRFIKFRTGK